MDLIVVESPTKARTLSKFLGSGFKIEASMGHIRDLPENKLGIDLEKNFEPSYVQTKKQKSQTDIIKEIAKEADKIYLATDPDREGEAISWHISEVLKAQKKVLRVTFHEITKHAIDEALKKPGKIDMDLVDAQQARRILDRLVGYKLSPLLWKKIRRGLSAGRVQSVALRLVVEREREIAAFVPEEYWEINVMLKNIRSSVFGVRLDAEIKNQDEAEKIEKKLLNTEYRILNIDKKDFHRVPPAPFTTSTLQQTAANKLGWSAKRTMQVAQSLYEQGLITYHRTDSTNIAAEAVVSCSEFIVHSYGKEYALDKPRIYKTKSKVAQEAHEAIRPTDIFYELSTMNHELNHDQVKLYELIWKRFVACQMAEATGVSVTVTVTGGEYKLKAKGETITFEGWHKIGMRDKAQETDLPKLEVGEELEFVSLEKMQKFTQGPARYNDASLIKALEEMGIGRPSTYAPTLTTIVDRQYVEKNTDRRYVPSSLGMTVSDFLMAHFANVMDYKFTALMENELDEIANGHKQWVPVIAEFYTPFAVKLNSVTDTAERVKIEVEKTGEKCPLCHEGNVIVRLGKFGKFLACSRFPECTYKATHLNKTGQKCEKCTSAGSVPIGDIIIRKTRTGRSFYGCTNYPTCTFASWNKPK